MQKRLKNEETLAITVYTCKEKNSRPLNNGSFLVQWVSRYIETDIGIEVLNKKKHTDSSNCIGYKMG